MKYYCKYHKRFLGENKLKEKCLKNIKRKTGYKKCKHLFILEDKIDKLLKEGENERTRGIR